MPLLQTSLFVFEKVLELIERLTSVLDSLVLRRDVVLSRRLRSSSRSKVLLFLPLCVGTSGSRCGPLCRSLVWFGFRIASCRETMGASPIFGDGTVLASLFGVSNVNTFCKQSFYDRFWPFRADAVQCSALSVDVFPQCSMSYLELRKSLDVREKFGCFAPQTQRVVPVTFSMLQQWH